jgi:hypothetical protein
VALGDNDQPQVEIERPPSREQSGKINLGRAHRFDAWRRADPARTELQRRARRQAFVLMVASSVLMVCILCGAWMALRGHWP